MVFKEELRGNPASGVKPNNSTSGRALATTSLAAKSWSKSIPVLGRENELIGVISLSGLVNRFTEDNIKNYLKVLLTISKKVCLAFGSK